MPKHAIKAAVVTTILLFGILVFSLFPERGLLSISTKFPAGAVAQDMEQFLEEEGFRILNYDEGSWGTISADFYISLSDFRTFFEEQKEVCSLKRCEMRFASKRLGDPIKNPLYHSHEVIWTESSGVILRIQSQDTLWGTGQ